MWNHTALPLKSELLVSSYCPRLLSLSKWNLFLSSPFSLNLSLWYSEKRANYSKCLCCIIVSPFMHSPLGSSYVKRLNPTALTTHRASKETRFSQCSLFLCFWVPRQLCQPISEALFHQSLLFWDSLCLEEILTLILDPSISVMKDVQMVEMVCRWGRAPVKWKPIFQRHRYHMRLAVLTSPGRTLIIPPHLPNEDYQTKSFSAIFIAIILIFQATAQFFYSSVIHSSLICNHIERYYSSLHSPLVLTLMLTLY